MVAMRSRMNAFAILLVAFATLLLTTPRAVALRQASVNNHRVDENETPAAHEPHGPKKLRKRALNELDQDQKERDLQVYWIDAPKDEDDPQVNNNNNNNNGGSGTEIVFFLDDPGDEEALEGAVTATDAPTADVAKPVAGTRPPSTNNTNGNVAGTRPPNDNNNQDEDDFDMNAGEGEPDTEARPVQAAEASDTLETAVPTSETSNILGATEFDIITETQNPSSEAETEATTTTDSQTPNGDQPSLPVLDVVQKDPNDPNPTLLQQCQGICNNDDDCAAGLICYSRQPGEDIPNCAFPPSSVNTTDDGVSVVLLDIRQSRSLLNFCTIGEGIISSTVVPTLTTSAPSADTTTAPQVTDTVARFVGNPPDRPLEQCEGDCDDDSDCADGLICLNRESGDPAYGCSFGSDLNIADDGAMDIIEAHDLCIEPPPPTQTPTATPTQAPTGTPTLSPTTATPTSGPTGIPTLGPTKRPTLAPTNTPTVSPSRAPIPANQLATFVGNPADRLLGPCEGDCDTDDDCEAGLICFLREPGQAVYGCEFGLSLGGLDISDSSDFCIPPPPPTQFPTKNPTPFPTDFPTWAPTTSRPTMPPTPLPTLPPTRVGVVAVEIGNPPPRPLGQCEGDCDDDDDCEPGLICWRREEGDDVYGCSFRPDLGGIELDDGSDLCVVPPPPTRAPTKRPTPAPTQYPTQAPKPPRVAQYLGNPYEYLLNRCQGDCDSNRDCMDGLVCYEREPGEGAPGCQFSGAMSIDDPSDVCVDRNDVYKENGGISLLRLHWQNGYRWQEDPREQYWCLNRVSGGGVTFSGTNVNREHVQVARCNSGDKDMQWQIIQFPEYGYGQALLRNVRNGECLTGGGIPGFARCDASKNDQRWKTMNGFWGGVTDAFEITRDGRESTCLSNHHHPRSGEVVSMQNCADQRTAKTSLWELYW